MATTVKDVLAPHTEVVPFRKDPRPANKLTPFRADAPLAPCFVSSFILRTSYFIRIAAPPWDRPSLRGGLED
ncbi:MAG: hypothetical protein ACREIC_15620, partial [Limisphaerales bacterium]